MPADAEIDTLSAPAAGAVNDEQHPDAIRPVRRTFRIAPDDPRSRPPA
jgi:hypothetical protein